MGVAREFGSVRHLAARFFGALSPAGPAPADEAWALASLLPGEQELWRRMSGPDRRHAVAVARETLALLGDEAGAGGASDPASAGGAPNQLSAGERPVIASALLHDVGKVEAGLGTFARVGVTVAAIVVGRDRLAQPEPGRWRERAARYLAHDRIGAELLRAAGSDPLTVAWAGEHHLDPSRWSVDPRVGAALKAADGD